MRTTDINVLIFEGDHVVDNMDNSVRTISQIQDHGDSTATVHLVDGGCMALSEISFDDIRMDEPVYEILDDGVDPDEEAEKSGYYDDEHYRSEMQAAYSDGQL